MAEERPIEHADRVQDERNEFLRTMYGELWENINGGTFSKVYDGPNTSKSFSNKPDGTYRYKAKACNVVGCSGYSPTKTVQVCNGACSFALPPPEE